MQCTNIEICNNFIQTNHINYSKNAHRIKEKMHWAFQQRPGKAALFAMWLLPADISQDFVHIKSWSGVIGLILYISFSRSHNVLNVSIRAVDIWEKGRFVREGWACHVSLCLLSWGFEVINHSGQIYSKTIEQRKTQTEREGEGGRERVKVRKRWKATVRWRRGESCRAREWRREILR